MTSPSLPGMGALVHDGGVAFRVWAPHAETVHVTGTFNEWRADAHPMADEGNGHWYVDVPAARAGDEYQFVLRSPGFEAYRVDPRARQVTSSVGNAVVVDPSAFDWQGDDFTCPPHHELVIYETHVGSFMPGIWGGPGDLGGLISRLDHLVALGVNAIELMPVMEFAGDFSWGYNPAHIFAVESRYGGPEQLRTLVREAHRKGIAVIADVVYNHFGPSDLDLWQFDGWSENGKGGIYFYNDHRSATPWGDTRPDYGRQEVRDLIRDNARMWLEEYHVDGLRLDMTPFMRSVDGTGHDIPEGWQVMRLVADAVHELDPSAIVIAEDLHADPAVSDPGPDGAGMDAQWCNQFVHPVRAALTTPDDGARDLGSVIHALEHQYGDNPFARVVYTESHDEVANGSARVPQEIDPADPASWAAQKRAALGIGLAMTAKGIPMLFQGQELLEDEWFRDSVPLDWDRGQRFEGIGRLVADLVRLRRNAGGDTAGLTGGGLEVVHADDATKLVVYRRVTGEGYAVLVAANLSGQPVSASVPLPGDVGRWAVRFNSDASLYSPAFSNHPTGELVPADGHAQVDVGPYSLVIWVPA